MAFLIEKPPSKSRAADKAPGLEVATTKGIRARNVPRADFVSGRYVEVNQGFAKMVGNFLEVLGFGIFTWKSSFVRGVRSVTEFGELGK
jgi:hypothetical protein